MSFEDLPDNWSDIALTDAQLPDLADLCVGEADRQSSCLAFLFLDDAGRLSLPLVISEVPDEPEEELLMRFLAHLRDLEGGSIVFVRGRTGPATFTDHDRAWHEAVLAGLTTPGGGTLVRAAYLATPGLGAIRAFPRPLAVELAS